MRISRVAAHIDGLIMLQYLHAKICMTKKHLTRPHNLPVTATDAVDGVSSMEVVDLQLGSKDP